jgi:hypothetical protein
MNDRKPRIGPMMRAVAEYVSAVPGCSKRGATLAVGAYYNHSYQRAREHAVPMFG